MRAAVENIEERRGKLRVDTKIMVKVGEMSRTFAGNLSKGGVFLETSEPFAKVGDRIQMELKLPRTSEGVRVTGKVIRVTGPHRVSRSPGMAIEFLRIEARQVRTFQRFLDRLLEAAGIGSRKHPRIKARVHVELASKTDVKHAISENVSKGGIFLRVPVNSFTLGDQLKLVLSHPASKRDFACKAEVVHLRKGVSPIREDFVEGIGVQFLGLAAGRKNEVATFLRNLLVAKK